MSPATDDGWTIHALDGYTFMVERIDRSRPDAFREVLIGGSYPTEIAAYEEAIKNLEDDRVQLSKTITSAKRKLRRLKARARIAGAAS